MIVVELTDEVGERPLFEKLAGRAKRSEWKSDPAWGQTGVLWFEKPEDLRDALIQATMFSPEPVDTGDRLVVPKSPADVEIGDEVLVGQGTKSGWGTVRAVPAGGIGKPAWLVSFPEVDYPQSMVQPSGEYFVLFEHILGIKKKAK